MQPRRLVLLVVLLLLLRAGALAQPAAVEAEPLAALFPPELTQFTPYSGNPIFTGQGAGHWDVAIRERGWIINDSGLWRLWYTGYDGTRPGKKMLGYATSDDGLRWRREPKPQYDAEWTEDVVVLKHEGTYYLFGEGAGDQAQWFTSSDGLDWRRQGTLDVRYTNGKPLTPGPFGTPFVWVEGDVWYLTYERGDRAIWLATSRDLKQWTHVRDEPIMVPTPSEHMIAINQILKRHGRYFAIYHSIDDPEKRTWCTNLATSTDLLSWERYPENPLLRDNQSSGIYVAAPDGLRLYTMHPQVNAYLPAREPATNNKED